MSLQATNPSLSRLTAALTLALSAWPTMAQQVPDAGQLLQQDRSAPSLPKAGPSIQIAPAATAASLPGGATVVLKGVRFAGNTRFGSEQLDAVLGSVADRSFDLAGLQALAQKISEHYRAAGYPFARAFVPEQQFTDAILQITIVEGRYGQIKVNGDSRIAAAAQNFLAPLVPGAVIESASLERATLILDDQPGLQTAPLIRPGQELGTGDLLIDVLPGPAFSGTLGLDNYGNRYTGEYRTRASLQWDSPFMLGDQIQAHGNVSNQAQWLGSLAYSLPLGHSGLRGNLSYARTRYELAEQFASLDATGTADIVSAGLSYPLIRSTQSNLSLTATYQHKKLDDREGATHTRSGKKSNTLPLTLLFDRRDGLGGGGITYGSLSYTRGRLALDNTLKAADAASARTQGSFHKWNLDVARLQATPLSSLSLFGRVATQSASKNLDSSEDFGLGGAQGVRAFPSGEGFGDQGWLLQLEARYQMGRMAPYAFYDAGHSKINKVRFSAGSNQRELAGYGLGVRYATPTWSAEAALAWRSRGSAPTSDTADRNPRLWLKAGWQF